MKVKFLTSKNSTAPRLTNTWGSLAEVFLGCLVEGYGTIISSSTSFNKEFLSITFSTPHSFLENQRILISGSLEESLNKEFYIYNVVSANEIVIQIPNNTLNSISTPLTVKVAPLGWELVYNKESQMVFKNKPTQGLPIYFYVRNNLEVGYTTSWAKYASIGMSSEYETEFKPQGISFPEEWDSLFLKGSGATSDLPVNTIWYNSSSPYLTAGYTPQNGSATRDTSWYIIGNESYFYIAITPFADSDFVFGGVGSYPTIHQGFNRNSFLIANLSTYKANTNNSFHRYFTTNILNYRSYNNCGLLGDYFSDKSSIGTLFSIVEESGVKNIDSTTSPLLLWDIYIRDSARSVLGFLPNIYALNLSRPFPNEHVFTQGSNSYLVLNGISATGSGQIVFKISE